MVPVLLAARGSKRLVYLIQPAAISPALLLRLVTYLANLSSAALRLDITPKDFPTEGKAASPDTM